MSVLKIFTRLAVFCCALTVALFVTRLFLIPPPVGVQIATPARVNFKVQQVVLDRTRAQTYTQLTVERDPSAPAPARLWVWTYLFSQEGTIGRIPVSEPVEVRQPFAHGDRATLNLAAPCGACGGGTPRNYYARVNVSTESAAAARLPIDPSSSDIRSATPVVVAHAPER